MQPPSTIPHYPQFYQVPLGPRWTRLIIEQGQFPKDITQTQPRQQSGGVCGANPCRVFFVERNRKVGIHPPGLKHLELKNMKPTTSIFLDFGWAIHGLGSFLMGTEKHQCGPGIYTNSQQDWGFLMAYGELSHEVAVNLCSSWVLQ